MSSLPLSAAQAIISGALAAARKRSARALAMMVLDSGGHPVAFAREDGASLFRHDIARAKAMGALGMGDDTAVIAERAKGNSTFFQSLAVAVNGNIAFSPGGVLIRDKTGTILGSVGISGDTGEVDEACARDGLTEAGFGGGTS